MAYRAYPRTDRLRAACDAAGISVADLAEAMDIDQSSVYRILRGGIPSNQFIAGLAIVFGPERLGELLRFAHKDTPARSHTFAPVLLRRDSGAAS